MIVDLITIKGRADPIFRFRRLQLADELIYDAFAFWMPLYIFEIVFGVLNCGCLVFRFVDIVFHEHVIYDLI